MKAKEARELSNFSLEEIKKKKQIKKSLKKIFKRIKKETVKGSYKLYITYYALSKDQQTYLESIGYKVCICDFVSNMHSYLSWEK